MARVKVMQQGHQDNQRISIDEVSSEKAPVHSEKSC